MFLKSQVIVWTLSFSRPQYPFTKPKLMIFESLGERHTVCCSRYWLSETWRMNAWIILFLKTYYLLNEKHGVRFSTCLPWLIQFSSQEKEWQPTAVFLPGKSHGQRGLSGYSPWGHRVKHDLVTRTTANNNLSFSHFSECVVVPHFVVFVSLMIKILSTFSCAC